MTSQLNVDTIVDKAGSGGTNVKVANTSTYVSDGGGVTQNLVQGSCKQWCDFDTSGTIAIRDSFNTSSVVDFASGYSENHYTNNFNTQDYVGSGSATGSGYGSPAVMSDARNTKLTSEVKIRHLHGTTNGAVNPDDIMFHQHGDLA